MFDDVFVDFIAPEVIVRKCSVFNSIKKTMNKLINKKEVRFRGREIARRLHD